MRYAVPLGLIALLGLACGDQGGGEGEGASDGPAESQGDDDDDDTTPDDDDDDETGDDDDDETGDDDDDDVIPDLPDDGEPALPPRPDEEWCHFVSDPGLSGTGQPSGSTAPALLSSAGCFSDLGRLIGTPDVIPYELNAPLWTDGAYKIRQLHVPLGKVAVLHDDGELELPEGALVFKHFLLPSDPDDPSTLRPVETRVMIRTASTWAFVTYQWNDEGDAELLTDGLYVELATGPYSFPGREECAYCHGPEGVRLLGPRGDQLERYVEYPDGWANQIDALVEAGWLEVEGDGMPDAGVIPDPLDEDADIESRARAYLHSNCGHCHRPGGWTPPEMFMDLRYTTPLEDTNACGVEKRYYNPWAPGDYRIDPGNADNSMLATRPAIRGLGQMPPLGTHAVDEEGVAVVRQWIESLDGCP